MGTWQQLYFANHYDTQSEIYAALRAPDAPVVGGVEPELVEFILPARLNTLMDKTTAEQRSTLAKEATENRLNYRVAQLERVTTAIETILQRREEESLQLRRQGIYRRVSQYLRTLERRSREKDESAQRLDWYLAQLLGVERELEQKVRQQAARVGLGMWLVWRKSSTRFDVCLKTTGQGASIMTRTPSSCKVSVHEIYHLALTGLATQDIGACLLMLWVADVY